MSKLKTNLPARGRVSNTGSALVGVLVFSMVMAIAGAGYLSVATSAVSHEVVALNNGAALLAAESGLLMGADWLHRSGALPTTDRSVFSASGSNSVQISENGKTYYVDIVVKASTGNASEVWSEAYTSPTVRTSATFLKRLKMRAQADDFGRYGTYIGNGPANPSSWGGITGKTFRGRFHWNDPDTRLRLTTGANQAGTTSTVRFFGDVTVANSNQSLSNVNISNETGNNLNLTGATGNPYSRGLAFRDNPINAAYADALFNGRYRGGADVVASPSYVTGFASGSFGSASSYSLPVDAKVEGSGDAHYRPTLQYRNDGTAVYKYYATAGASAQDSVTLAATNVNNKVLYAQTDINVKGSVLGNTTLATKSGKSICVVGDLTYKDFNPAGNPDNYGVPAGSTNALGLVSGKNIVFNPNWVPTYHGASQDVLGSGVSGTRTKLYLNANMLMVNPAMTAGNNGYEEWITGSGDYKYVLEFCGTQGMNFWQPTTSGPGTGGETITYNYDSRYASAIHPYGFQSLQTADSHLILSYSRWTESNVY